MSVLQPHPPCPIFPLCSHLPKKEVFSPDLEHCPYENDCDSFATIHDTLVLVASLQKHKEFPFNSIIKEL